MVKIQPFDVEQWMDTYENTPDVLNIAETCSSSISISQLEELNSADGRPKPIIDFSAKLTYGAIRGTEELRRGIAALYNDENENENESPLSADDILITQGAIAANHLIFYSLVGPGDHVICVYPTYQQLYSVPESLGAEVSLWRLREEDGYVPNIEELKKLIKSNTKMLVLNNPNNPTGAITPLPILSQIISIAQKHNITILSDEVYRPLLHSPLSPSPSALTLSLSHSYPLILSTSSVSKAWSLAGLRLGWIATRSQTLMKQLTSARDYTTISVSLIDDSVARYALTSARDKLLARNMALARTNLALMTEFVEEDFRDFCDWTRPQGGTTAFVRFKTAKGEPVDDEEFCKDVLQKTGVLFVPGGKCFGRGVDFRGFVRIGYVCETEVLRSALERLGGYVREYLG
ncbi:PLP-dependent transferase [Poronia punctata]|nr:PLP-dependent transferase [Poronia punctata]